MKLLLHIGMGKCGSSALQTYLCSEEFSAVVSGRCAYVALHQDGSLLWGDSLSACVATSVFGYCSSHTGSAISELDSKQRKNVVAQLKALGEQYDTLILSNEGWGPNPEHFIVDCLFSDPAFDVSVLAYVRPQVEWMNSAWWQWGAWTKAPMPRWVNNNRPKAQWYALIQQWNVKPWVNQVDIRLLDGDVVQDFMAYLGYTVPASSRTNQSLSASVLRLFQHNRQLRPGPHDSAIEFAMARHLSLEAGKNPWVLKYPQVEQLIEFYRQDNEQLVDILPTEQSKKMLRDPRWWQAETYAARNVSPPSVKKLNVHDLEQLSVAALEAIVRLDGEVRKLQRRLSVLKNSKE